MTGHESSSAIFICQFSQPKEDLTNSAMEQMPSLFGCKKVKIQRVVFFVRLIQLWQLNVQGR